MLGLATVATLICLGVPDGAPPMSAVVISRRTGLTEAEGATLSAQLREALAGAGLKESLSTEQINARLSAAGVADTAFCDGDQSCIANLGMLLGVQLIITAELGVLRNKVAFYCEAVVLASRQLIGSYERTIGRDAPLTVDDQLRAFVTRVSAASASLVKAAPQPPAVAARPDRRGWAVLPAIAGVAAGVIATGLFASAKSRSDAITGGGGAPRVASLSEATIQAQAGKMEQTAGFALTGVFALGLGGATAGFILGSP